MTTYNLIFDPLTNFIEGITAAQEAPIGKQPIPLEMFEFEYIRQNIKPWRYDNDNGAFRYIICEAGDSPIMSLTAGYHFRLRSANELAQDPDHPIYPVAYFHMDLTDPYGDEPPGIEANGTDQMQIAIVLRSGPEADSPIMTQISDTWRITIRKVISENDLTVIDTDVRRLPLVNGEKSFNYTSTEVGVYVIDEKDFNIFEAVGITYQVKLAQPVIFKVWQ